MEGNGNNGNMPQGFDMDMDALGEPNMEQMEALEEIMQRTERYLENLNPMAFGQLTMQWTMRLMAGETVDQIVASIENSQRANGQ